MAAQSQTNSQRQTQEIHTEWIRIMREWYNEMDVVNKLASEQVAEDIETLEAKLEVAPADVLKEVRALREEVEKLREEH